MTQEEKLEEAKRLYKTANTDQKYVLERLFPELKESEGEKIIKFISNELACLRATEITGSDRYEELTNAIAWLEKQGECEFDCPQNHQDVNRPNGCIVLEDFNDGEGFYKMHLDYLNKKQVEEIEEMVRAWNKEPKASNEDIKNCIGMCLTDVNEQRFNDYNTSLKDCLNWLEKQGEQNHAEWSEIDKANLEDSIYFVKEFRRSNLCDNESRLQNSRTCIEWLASLKDRVLPQPMQGWSEEDRKIIIELVGIFESAIDGGYVDIPYRLIKDYIRVLKSCLLQTTWKPSDEQMDALWKTLKYLHTSNAHGKAIDGLEELLEQLHEQLKKLREEGV